MNWFDLGFRVDGRRWRFLEGTLEKLMEVSWSKEWI
ncbi:MAG: hypothetical protein ACI92G_001913 [Candidatus Pelagisphaera sp.]|jgi:hypothetical protein